MTKITRRMKVEKILKTIPAGTKFTCRDISDMSRGARAVTVMEVSGVIKQLDYVRNLTHYNHCSDIYIKLDVTE